MRAAQMTPMTRAKLHATAPVQATCTPSSRSITLRSNIRSVMTAPSEASASGWGAATTTSVAASSSAPTGILTMKTNAEVQRALIALGYDLERRPDE